MKWENLGIEIEERIRQVQEGKLPPLVPRHSGRYPWYNGKGWHQLDAGTKKKEVSRLKEKGMNVWMMADRIGTTVEEIEELLLDEH